MKLYPAIEKYLKSLDTNSISDERKSLLKQMADTFNQQLIANQELAINFICTHNSRRSHLAQIWMQTVAQRKGLNSIYCYSAGTEATALHSNIIAVLTGVGFEINALVGGNNPVYLIKSNSVAQPIIGFSKTLNHPYNPKKDFIAAMTCEQADNDCPFVAGATAKIALAYNDPKAFDDTPEEVLKYEERSKQIATEMLFLSDLITKHVE